MKSFLAALFTMIFIGGVTQFSGLLAKDEGLSGGFKPSRTGKSEMVHIDFPEPTDLRDVIKAVAQWTGKNVVLGRNVTGKVQIISPTEVSKEEAYEIFLSALNVAGYTTIQEGKVIKILHTRNAMKENIQTFKGKYFPKTAQVITRVIQLKYVDAVLVKKTLDPFVNRAELVVYAPTNTIILSTTGHKVDHVLDIIGLLDVKTQQPTVRMIPIQFADAKDIVSKLKQVYLDSSQKKTENRGNFRIEKVLTDERTNSIIFMGNNKAYAEVIRLVNKLDTQIEDALNQAKIHIHPLEYADAEKISGILSNLASGRSSSAKTRYSKAKKPVSAPGGSVADFGDMKITAEPTTNSLIITGNKAAYKSLVTIVDKIDVRRPQVFVEAEILDVNLQEGLGFGTSLMSGSPNLFGKEGAMAIYGFNAGESLGIATMPGTTSGSASTATAASSGALLTNTVLGVLGGTKVPFMGAEISTPAALISALKTDGNTEVLSNPSIMTSDNEEATISVGSRVPFLKFQSTTAEGGHVNSSEFEDVLLQLTIKPKISKSSAISLVINLKNDELGPKNAAGTPSINKRETKTTVTVDNHQTIVISGLLRKYDTEGRNKIPLLGDLPILGWLFSRSTIEKQQSYLLVFLSPHIIRSPEDMQDIYQRKMRERKEFLRSAFGRAAADEKQESNGDEVATPVAPKEKTVTIEEYKENPKPQAPAEGGLAPAEGSPPQETQPQEMPPEELPPAEPDAEKLNSADESGVKEESDILPNSTDGELPPPEGDVQEVPADE